MNKSEKRYKVSLMGASLETGNMGVSALAASLVNIISELRPNADISFLVGNRTGINRSLYVSGRLIHTRVVNFRLSPRSRLSEQLFWILFMAAVWRIAPLNWLRKIVTKRNQFLKTLSESDFIGSIHGGDSFSDIYGLKRFIVGAIPDIVAILMERKLYLLPQTYGPYNHLISRAIARFIIRRAAGVLSRDKAGTAAVSQMLEKEAMMQEAVFCPDVAFCLEPSEVTDTQIEPPLEKDQTSPIVGLNVNGLLYWGGYSRKNMFGLKWDYRELVHELIGRFMTETQAHILLISHTYDPSGGVDDDPTACRDVVGSINEVYKNRVHFAGGNYDQSMIKTIIGKCDFFIGSRMHACIAAVSQSIPTVAIAYSMKFWGVFDSIGLGNMIIDARTEELELSIDYILGNFKRRDRIGANTWHNVAMAKKQIKKRFEEIL